MEQQEQIAEIKPKPVAHLVLNERTGEIIARDSGELMRQIKLLMQGKAFPKTMLCWRAQGMAWKFEFGDALLGAEIAEYRFNQFPDNPEMRTVSPIEKTEEINKLYSGEQA